MSAAPDRGRPGGGASSRPAAPWILLTGPQASGKTSALERILRGLASRGRPLRAVLQPARSRHPDGKAEGFSLELLAGTGAGLSARRLPLAREVPPGAALEEGELAFGRFAFRLSAFEEAARFLRGGEGEAPPALVGLDEVGRLELERRAGLAACLDWARATSRREGRPAVVLGLREDQAERLRVELAEEGLAAELHACPLPDEGLAAIIESLDAWARASRD